MNQKKKKKALAALIAGTLVLGFVGAGTMSTQEARAQQPVTRWDKILQRGFLETGPHGIALKSWEYLYGKALDFINSLHLNQKLNGSKKENSASIIGHAITLARTNRETRKTQKNHIEDARNLVWAKIKNSSIYSLNHKRTRAYAIQHTKEIVSDYYATIEYNLANHQSAFVATLKNLQNKSTKARTEYEYPFYVKAKTSYYTWGYLNTITKTKDRLQFYKRNLTLVNGSTIKVWDIKPIKFSREHIRMDPVAYSDERANTGHSPKYTKIMVKALNTKDKTIYESMKWERVFNKIQEENQLMRDNAQKYITKAYEQYRSGEINISDLIDADTLVSQLNTQINKTGYYAYAGVKLSLLGINTTLTNTFQIQLLETNQSLNGMLFTNHVPRTNGSFKVNTTYYPNNWTNNLYFVGDKYREIKQPFKIKSIHNYQGETISSSGLETYNRQTTNTSKIKEELGQLNTLYNITVNYSPTGAGGTKPKGTTLNDLLGSLANKTLGIPNYIIFLTITVLSYGFITTYAKSIGDKNK